MGALMRSVDWSRTPVGPVEGWPQSLRTALSILLETGFPMYIAWGPGFTQFYNDGYRPILGSTKHPAAMGISTRQTFAEIWHIIGPMFEGVMRGEPVSVTDFLLPLDRHGFAEECYFIFSYSPIREESGQVGGVLVTVTETTERVLGARRLKMLQALATQTQGAQTVADAAQASMRALGGNPADIPFALLYLLDATGEEAKLAGRVGAGPESTACSQELRLDDEGGRWPVARCIREGAGLVIASEGAAPAPVPLEGLRLPGQVVVLPVVQAGEAKPVGALVCGLNPMLALDEGYLSFLALMSGQIGTALVNARTLVEAKNRAEALAELDRAKTTFFNNVSHEFRTPLTLMLGPLSDALAAPAASLAGEDLEAVHRNALRLLKLVNSLLDFARLDARRVEPSFEEVDLATFTQELASSFQSATDRAGLKLETLCAPLAAPTFVDREMWEKIVLNLLSNAFKHTLQGRIRVELKVAGTDALLSVADTGVGIHPDELPRVFERFHRVQGAKGRSFEGTGIGLALVQQLVSLHGGRVWAESELERGSTFYVSIPLGRRHLPEGRIAPRQAPRSTRIAASAFVEEALQWVKGANDDVSEPARDLGAAAHTGALTGARVLVADDNADMRGYLARILGAHCEVILASDGAEALELARSAKPALVLTDVMMPRLDGFGLLRELRASAETQRIPLVMLSARAGEEARIEALRGGADDYLTKPFTARELVARLEVQLTRARLRKVEEEQTERLNRLLMNAPVGMAVLSGPEHRFESANADYLRVVGGRTVQGRTVREAFPELAKQGIYELLDSVYRTGEPYVGRSVRLVLHGAEGPKEGYFDFLYQPNRGVDGAVDGILVVVFDVTELSRARDAAEAASRAKDEFLAVLGHELRNPLAPIVTALRLLEHRGLPGAERELALIDRQVSHLIRLVDDLLDVSRVASGKVELKREVVELASVVRQSVEQTRPMFEARRHELSLRLPEAGLPVHADATRLSQVITNLLVNAAKYTDPGGKVRVTGALEGEQVVLRIRDNGVGISAELLPNVFEMFVQGRQSLDRALGGLGLGLTLVRSIVQMHGGTVEAFSAGAQQGSEFVVRLPRAVGHAYSGAPEARGQASSAPMRVLLVDDNQDAANVLGEYLQLLGMETRVSHSGDEALAAAESFRPDAALLDLGLPGMDGYELCRRLRQMPRGRELVVFAVTGYGQPADTQRTAQAGFDQHFVKPVNLDSLTAALVRAVSAEAKRPS